jgi:hypothetical protein
MKKRSLAVCTILFLLMACNSTHIISSWKAEGASADKYDKILVIGMAGSRDAELRSDIESSMVKRLQERGLTAVSSWSQYGPKTFDKMSEEEAAAMVKKDGFEAVMEIALLDKDKEKNYVPGQVSYSPYAVARSHWYPGYRVFYNRVYTPGYFTTTTNYTLEANFYSTKADILEYTATAKSYSPGSKSALAGDFAKTVVDDMIKLGIVTK